MHCENLLAWWGQRKREEEGNVVARAASQSSPDIMITLLRSVRWLMMVLMYVRLGDALHPHIDWRPIEFDLMGLIQPVRITIFPIGNVRARGQRSR